MSSDLGPCLRCRVTTKPSVERRGSGSDGKVTTTKEGRGLFPLSCNRWMYLLDTFGTVRDRVGSRTSEPNTSDVLVFRNNYTYIRSSLVKFLVSSLVYVLWYATTIRTFREKPLLSRLSRLEGGFLVTGVFWKDVLRDEEKVEQTSLSHRLRGPVVQRRFSPVT